MEQEEKEEEEERRVQQNHMLAKMKAADVEHKKEEKRNKEKQRAEREDAEARQKRLRHLSRNRNTKAAENEDLTPKVSVGQKRKVSTTASIPSTSNNIAITSSKEVVPRSGIVKPPTFDIGNLGGKQQSLSLKKLIEADAQQHRPSTSRSELQKGTTHEVTMRHGFKSGLLALHDDQSRSLPPSSDPGSNTLSSPSPNTHGFHHHQVPTSKPGMFKALNSKRASWKKAQSGSNQTARTTLQVPETEFVEGSSTGLKRKHN
jgi:hypothetical protein